MDCIRQDISQYISGLEQIPNPRAAFFACEGGGGGEAEGMNAGGGNGELAY